MSDGTDIEVIAPDGDVLLVAGNKYQMKTKLRVSSHTLSNTSPVFKAMLGPHFREGQELRSQSNTGPVEIPLPEDDPEAMTLMCRLLHWHEAPAEDEQLVHSLSILTAALVFDKYQVVGVLHWQIRGVLSHWLSDFDGEIEGAHTCVATIAATWLLNCDDAYSRATGTFINHAVDGITCLVGSSEITNIIPVQILLILEARRAEMRAKLAKGDVSGDGVARDEGLCLRCSKADTQDESEKCVGPHAS